MFPYVSGYVVLTVVIVYYSANKQATVSFYDKILLDYCNSLISTFTVIAKTGDDNINI